MILSKIFFGGGDDKVAIQMQQAEVPKELFW